MLNTQVLVVMMYLASTLGPPGPYLWYLLSVLRARLCSAASCVILVLQCPVPSTSHQRQTNKKSAE